MISSVPQIPGDELTPLIARGMDLCEAGVGLIDDLRSEHGTGATLPESTVIRLHFVAVSTFQSGLLCLWMPETSLAAFSMVRGLLEVWSHLTFIHDDTQGGDPRCRALRYERGALQEWADTVTKAPDYGVPTAWQANHEARKRDVELLWRECECTGQPRTRRNVTATLKSLATQPTMDWVPGVWSASSASAHTYGIDFLLRSKGEETRLVWALPSQRATWFAFLVATFDYLTATAAIILASGDEQIGRFQKSAGELLKDNHLASIANGAFDD